LPNNNSGTTGESIAHIVKSVLILMLLRYRPAIKLIMLLKRTTARHCASNAVSQCAR
jgi:hypothetical protein